MNRISFLTLPLLVALPSLVISPAVAQDSDAADLTLATSDRASQSERKASIELTALEGDGRATLSLQFGSEAENFRLENGGGASKLRLRQNQLDVSFSVPLSEGADFQELATLDGLGSGYKLEFNFSGATQGFRSLAFEDTQRAAQTALDMCRADPAPKNPCPATVGDANNSTFISRYIPNYKQSLARKMTDGLWRYGATAALGYDSFDYRDPTSLAELNEKKFSYEFSGYASYLFPTGLTSVTGQLKYASAYETGDKQILCPPNPTNTVIECFNDPTSAPTRDKSVLASLDLRHYVGRIAGAPMAVSPQFTYDISDDIFGIDLPIYLVGDGKGGLTGGLRTGWRSDTKNVTVGIFIGKRFGHD